MSHDWTFARIFPALLLVVVSLSYPPQILASTPDDPPTMSPADLPSRGSSRIENVFEQDNRIPMNQLVAPFKFLGLLKIVKETKNFQCTAVLIGKDLILTNRHCIFSLPNSNSLAEKITFYPGYTAGRFDSSSAATLVKHGDWNLAQSDWAILRLESPLGAQIGFLQIAPFRQADIGLLKGQIIQAGYSGDYLGGKTAGAHIGCSLMLYTDLHGFSHDCDMARGSSGSPLIYQKNGVFLIGALVYAERRDNFETSLIGIPYKEFQANLAIRVDDVKEYLEQHP